MVAQQTKLNFQPADEIFSTLPALHTGKFDMEAMREAAAHWVLMHEHPFTILEEEGFNIIMRWECQSGKRSPGEQQKMIA